MDFSTSCNAEKFIAVAYIIVAGGVIQLASAAFPAWDLPNWTLRLVIVVLLLGFSIALMLAWATTLPRTVFGRRQRLRCPERIGVATLSYL
jgi:hypothetical protein